GTALISTVALLRYLLAPATASPWRHALWFPVLACMICPFGPHISFTTALGSGRAAQIAAPQRVNPSAGAIPSRPFRAFERPSNSAEALAGSHPTSPNS